MRTRRRHTLVNKAEVAGMIRRSILLITLLQIATATIAATPTVDTSSKVPASHPVQYTAQYTATMAPADSEISRLLTVTGITNQLPEIYAMLEQSRESNSVRCGAAPDTIGDSTPYHPTNLHTRLAGLLQKQLQQPSLGKVLAWYESDIGKRVQASEKKLRDISSFTTYIGKAKQSQNWKSRIALIKHIERHTSANRLGAATGLEIEYAGLVHSGCIETYAKNHFNKNLERTAPTPTPKQINRELQTATIIRSDQAFYEKLFYPDTLESMAFSLQDVSDDDLARYAEFVASTAARQVFATLVDMVVETLKDASPSLPHSHKNTLEQNSRDQLSPENTSKFDY